MKVVCVSRDFHCLLQFLRAVEPITKGESWRDSKKIIEKLLSFIIGRAGGGDLDFSTSE